MTSEIETLYKPGNTFFHRLDPRTKLGWMLGMMIFSFLFFDPKVLFLVCVFNFVLLLWSTGKYALTSPISEAVLLLAVPQIIVHGCVNAAGVTPVVFMGSTISIPLLGTLKWEGVYLGLSYAFRMLGVGYATLLFIATTHPRDLVKGFERLGLPFKYSFMIMMSLQLIPEAIRETRIILEAQQSRGMKMRGFLERLRALLPVFVPITIGSMQRVQMMSMALDARAYGAPVQRTELRDFHLHKADKIMLCAISIMIVIGIYLFLSRIL